MSALRHSQAAQMIQLGLTYRWSWTTNVKNLLFILHESIILTSFSCVVLIIQIVSVSAVDYRKCWRLWSPSMTWWGGTPTRVYAMRLPTNTWTSSSRWNLHRKETKDTCLVLFCFFNSCVISSRKWIKTGTALWPSKSSLRPARRFVFLQPAAVQIYRFYIFVTYLI